MKQSVSAKGNKSSSTPKISLSYCFEPNCPDYGVTSRVDGEVTHRCWSIVEEYQNFSSGLRGYAQLPKVRSGKAKHQAHR